MNRDIKFRAWIDCQSKMLESVTLSEMITQWSTPIGWATVMQYTGLRDNKGADIYERDIVSDHVGIGVVEYSGKYAAFRVNYKDGRCKWFYDYTLRGERESIVVIGNDLENPELMEAIR